VREKKITGSEKMKLDKYLNKLPSFFSNKNIYRKYKLYLYTGKEEGKIVFFEKVKKDFVMVALVAAMKKIKKPVKKSVKAPKKFKATAKDLQKFPGTGSFINKKMEQFVQQIKNKWKKRHPNWELWRHDFSFIEFVENEPRVYDITFELKIWVSGVES